MHQAGYVFGDFNPRNIGLDKNTGLVSFLDTDTYHVADHENGKTYRCNVCAPGYAAPELLEKCADYVASNPSASKAAYAQTPLPTFTQETDNFALAIHIFKLLMNGYTPFGGIIETASVSQSSPGVGDAAVRRDSYCFKPGYKHQSAAIMPLEVFPKEIEVLFTRAFITGKTDPKQRPAAAEWYEALTRFEESMVTCSDNPLHQYDGMNDNCPLCEAETRFMEAIGGGPSMKQSAYATPPKVLRTPTSTQGQTSQARVSSSVQGRTQAAQTSAYASAYGQRQQAQATTPTATSGGAGRVAVAIAVIIMIVILPMIWVSFSQPAAAPGAAPPPAAAPGQPATLTPTAPPAPPPPAPTETVAAQASPEPTPEVLEYTDEYVDFDPPLQLRAQRDDLVGLWITNNRAGNGWGDSGIRWDFLSNGTWVRINENNQGTRIYGTWELDGSNILTLRAGNFGWENDTRFHTIRWENTDRVYVTVSGSVNPDIVLTY